MSTSPHPSIGQVALVGAGPGDPGLLTVRGLACLRAADAVLYDYLVNPALLDETSADCQQICLGKHGTTRLEEIAHAESGDIVAERPQRLWSQTEINAKLVELALAGKRVVRLKGGDPMIFGRLAEECAALAERKIPFEIVPGITAALAAPAYAGVFVTQRENASAVALITGHEQEAKESTALDYAALAAFPGTLVFYMGVTRVREWSAALLTAGKSSQTPVVVVRRCAWPDQTQFTTTLDRVVAELTERRLRPPILCIVGEVAAAKEQAAWFTQRPLFGRTILITRPAAQAAALVERLQELGAHCMIQPTIEITPPHDWSHVDRMLTRLADFSWLIFSSANGVRYFMERLMQTGRDARAFGPARIGAIGPATAEALGAWHLRADLVPAEYRAESLADAIIDDANGRLQGQKCLLLRASRGREVLAEMLSAAGAEVEQITVYESRDLAQADPEIAAALAAGRVDWITVTSSAIARSMANLFGQQLKGIKLVSLSPITSATLTELGFTHAAEAVEYTMAGLVAAILSAEQQAVKS